MNSEFWLADIEAFAFRNPPSHLPHIHPIRVASLPWSSVKVKVREGNLVELCSPLLFVRHGRQIELGRSLSADSRKYAASKSASTHQDKKRKDSVSHRQDQDAMAYYSGSTIMSKSCLLIRLLHNTVLQFSLRRPPGSVGSGVGVPIHYPSSHPYPSVVLFSLFVEVEGVAAQSWQP